MRLMRDLFYFEIWREKGNCARYDYYNTHIAPLFCTSPAPLLFSTTENIEVRLNMLEKKFRCSERASERDREVKERKGGRQGWRSRERERGREGGEGGERGHTHTHTDTHTHTHTERESERECVYVCEREESERVR